MNAGRSKKAIVATGTEIALTQRETTECRKAFAYYDSNGAGSLDAKGLREALNSLGQFHVTDDDIQRVFATKDPNAPREVELKEFLQTVASNKRAVPEDSDTREAFLALGGNYDTTGVISIPRLKEILERFDLKIDLQGLVTRLDRDRGGCVDYNEFSRLFEKQSSLAVAL